MRQAFFPGIILEGALLLWLLIPSCSPQNPTGTGTVERFTHNWEFLSEGADFCDPGKLDSLTSKAEWEGTDLPHSARIEPLVVNDQWQGICWYRKTFDYNPTWEGRLVLLRFEGAMNVAEVWINGKEAARHSGGYLPFTVDVTDELYRDRPNRIHVRLDNRDNPFTGPKPMEILDFNMYGGLYRDVLLITKNPIHITDEQLVERKGGGGVLVHYPEVSKEHAVVEVRTHLANAGKETRLVRLSMDLELEGRVVVSAEQEVLLNAGSDRDILTKLKVSHPELWSTADPVLHNLHIAIREGEHILDQWQGRIGIREISFREGRLLVNGQEHFLRGVNRHQEYPYIGYALSDNAQYRDALKIKEAGFDYVRLSHYPQSPAFLDACDELGLLVLNPILGWQYYNPDQRFRNQVYADARHLLRRDRNHACVLAWELSLNESGMPNDLIDTLVMIAREEYPAEQAYTAGWMEYGYDIFVQARQHRIGHAEAKPGKSYIVSEYGDWEYYAMNAGLKQDAWDDLLPEERSSRQLIGEDDSRLLQQVLNVQEAHNDNLGTRAVADGYWVMFDYNRGYADDLEASGVMSIFRQAKFSRDFFRSQRNPSEKVAGRPVGPVIAMASRMMEDSPESLKVFSNCGEVELIVNGNSLGTRQADQDRISGNLAHPPFTFALPGIPVNEITAIGKTDGNEVIRQTLQAPDRAAAIEIMADLSGRPPEAGCNDLIFVHARIVDLSGNLAFACQEEIRFTLSGDAEIIGNDHPVARAGLAAILVRIGRKPGVITLRAESEGLNPAELSLEVVPGGND